MENLKEEIEIEEENYPIAFVKFDFLARKERETNLRVGEKVLIYWVKIFHPFFFLLQFELN